MSTSILKSARHQAIGRKKYYEGAIFEAQFDQACRRKMIFYIEIPLCAKIMGKKVVPLKAPFDRILAATNVIAFIDLKSVKGKRFTRSMINYEQSINLWNLFCRGQKAGYIVNFRETDDVVFFSAKQLLWSYKESKSLEIGQGIHLGGLENMNPLLVFYQPDR